MSDRKDSKAKRRRAVFIAPIDEGKADPFAPQPSRRDEGDNHENDARILNEVPPHWRE